MDNVWRRYEIVYTYARIFNSVRQLFRFAKMVLSIQTATQIT